MTSIVFSIVFILDLIVPEFQALWKSRYLAEIEEIRLEIKRLEDIANSLPVECWNTIRLEPWENELERHQQQLIYWTYKVWVGDGSSLYIYIYILRIQAALAIRGFDYSRP